MCVKAKFWICLLLAVCFSVSRVSAYSAQAYAVLDADTGILLDGAKETQRLPMASTTKIMTGLLAAESGKLQQIITVSAASAGVEGSSMYLKQGEQLPLQEVLYGLMLCSGNDAAECIAENLGGRKAFVRRMNERAQQLGLRNTHFDNPSGLDGKTHYTTAYELAQLAAAALKNPIFAQIVATKSYTAGTRTMVNHNKLLRMYPDAVGVKTGYTLTAGRCLVSAAKRNGRTVVAVTLHDRDDWNDHMHMLDAAFASMRTQTAAQAGEAAQTIPVQTGEQRQVQAVYQKDLTAPLFDGEQAEIRVSCAAFLYAPVQEGDNCGSAQLVCNGVVLDETALVCAQSVALDTAQEDTSLSEKLRHWWDAVRKREVIHENHSRLRTKS